MSRGQCIDHLVAAANATEPPLHCCAPCAAECEPIEEMDDLKDLMPRNSPPDESSVLLV